MAWIKKMVMNGFKSFGRKTEIIFGRGINVVIGPNGSGKSNVSDGLCFALGRLSIKSMRAAKAKNLIFMGSKFVKPSREASVRIIFDNHDKSFSIDKAEIELERIVRLNGQSIYKINGEVKTRADVIEMLAQAGIDPHGFNMVLQGQIQSIVKMHPEDRRKIIEEVAGIAIYESRKEKSLHELEKTDERLKEISAILRERTAYLRNLEREKAQAERFKELEQTIKRAKSSIISKKLTDKEKEIQNITKSIEEKTKEKDKFKEKVERIQAELEKSGERIQEINKAIQRATGLEQETLNDEIANLKAEIEGFRVRKEGHETRKEEIERRINEMQKSIPELESEIRDLRQKSPMMAKKAQELKKKKEELEEIGQERKRLLTIKTELNALKERIQDKNRQLGKITAESENVLKQLEENEKNLLYKDEKECIREIERIKKYLGEKVEEQHNLGKEELSNEKIISLSEEEIKRNEKIKKDIGNIDTCPLCQSKMTEFHVKHVTNETNEKIREAKEKLDISKNALSRIHEAKENVLEKIKEAEGRIGQIEREKTRHENINEKKAGLRRIVQEQREVEEEIKALDERRRNSESKVSDISKIEERYDSKMLEIEEISSRTEEDLDTTLLYKDRELENTKNIVKRSKSDLEEIEEDIGEISETLGSKEGGLEEKEKQEEELNKRFKKMFEERDRIQRESQEKSLEMTENQGRGRQIEEQINYLRIGKAKLDAEKEGLDIEMKEYSGLELLQGSIQVLQEKLEKSQKAIQEIGSINMRALEVYESVKGEYEKVEEKVNTLDKEKQDIMSIIEEIDKKKTKSFMKTFNSINTLFSENFAKLSNKGQAYLEIENKEDIFAGGVNIIVKLTRGKYFDVTSLSGGEQTLVALSLLFAIQEFKPYHFYIFDEIDAALDKRNSERLAALLQQYMKSGQYIVVTHNDAIIMNSDVLYGVSMQDGVSKILSLKIEEEINSEKNSLTQ